MNMEPNVSIVLPIYNVEKYLHRCLDSLLAQRMNGLEIVAVNDGSADGSLEILRGYAKRDGRIVVIDKPNGGVSAARNEGMAAARGRYIGFVDPDDWVEPDMFPAMYAEAAAEDADIVMCTYVREFGTHAVEKRFDMPGRAVLRGSGVRDGVLRRLVGPLGRETGRPDALDAWGTVWTKLYRRELIREGGLRFVDLAEVGTNEDTLFNLHAVARARSFLFLNRPYYHYWRANEASITSRHNPLLPEKFERLYGRMERFIADNGLPGEYREALGNRICLNVLGLGLNIAAAGREETLRRKLRAMRDLLGGSRLRRAIAGFDARGCPPHWRLFFLLVKYRRPAALLALLSAIEWLRTNRGIGGIRIGRAAGAHSSGRDGHEPRRPRDDADELLPPA